MYSYIRHALIFLVLPSIYGKKTSTDIESSFSGYELSSFSNQYHKNASTKPQHRNQFFNFIIMF